MYNTPNLQSELFYWMYDLFWKCSFNRLYITKYIKNKFFVILILFLAFISEILSIVFFRIFLYANWRYGDEKHGCIMYFSTTDCTAKISTIGSKLWFEGNVLKWPKHFFSFWWHSIFLEFLCPFSRARSKTSRQRAVRENQL